MQLLDLPIEVLEHIVNHVYDIHDLSSLRGSCTIFSYVVPASHTLYDIVHHQVDTNQSTSKLKVICIMYPFYALLESSIYNTFKGSRIQYLVINEAPNTTRFIIEMNEREEISLVLYSLGNYTGFIMQMLIDCFICGHSYNLAKIHVLDSSIVFKNIDAFMLLNAFNEISIRNPLNLTHVLENCASKRVVITFDYEGLLYYINDVSFKSKNQYTSRDMRFLERQYYLELKLFNEYTTIHHDLSTTVTYDNGSLCFLAYHCDIPLILFEDIVNCYNKRLLYDITFIDVDLNKLNTFAWRVYQRSTSSEVTPKPKIFIL